MGLTIVVSNETQPLYENVDSAHHAFENPRSPATTYGSYRTGTRTGSLAPTAGFNLWTFRWASPSRLAVIQSVCVLGQATLNGQEFIPQIFFARSYTARASGGTSSVPTARVQKVQTSMVSSMVDDIRVAGASSLTSGTWTLDNQPLIFLNSNRQGSFTYFASGNSLFGQDTSNTFPIVLSQNEGLVMQSLTSPSGSVSLTVSIFCEWIETSVY